MGGYGVRMAAEVDDQRGVNWDVTQFSNTTERVEVEVSSDGGLSADDLTGSTWEANASTDWNGSATALTVDTTDLADGVVAVVFDAVTASSLVGTDQKWSGVWQLRRTDGEPDSYAWGAWEIFHGLS